MEYLKSKGNEHLIGKRARFKDKVKGYCSFLFGQVGTIGEANDKILIRFDEPAKRHDEDHSPMKSCYVVEGSFDLLGE